MDKEKTDTSSIVSNAATKGTVTEELFKLAGYRNLYIYIYLLTAIQPRVFYNFFVLQEKKY